MMHILSVLRRVLRHRGRIFECGFCFVGGWWLAGEVHLVPSAAVPGSLPAMTAILLAMMLVRYGVYWLMRLRQSSAIVARLVRLQGRSRGRATVAGMIGGALGGLVSGPLIAGAYVTDPEFLRMLGICGGGVMLFCARFYWVVFCNLFAGLVLGGCITFFLYGTCQRQFDAWQRDGASPSGLMPGLRRTFACALGGIVAGLTAGPVIALGSAIQHGPVIQIETILVPAVIGVTMINLFIIGSFRSWQVTVMAAFVEGLLLAELAHEALGAAKAFFPGGEQASSIAVIAWIKGLPTLIDQANQYFFTCDTGVLSCAMPALLGAVTYPVIVGIVLSAHVCADAFRARPGVNYFRSMSSAPPPPEPENPENPAATAFA